MSHAYWALGPVLLASVASTAGALTLDEALERAKTRSLAAAVRSDRERGARAGLDAARTFLREPLELSAAAGRRSFEEERSLELEFGLAQPLELAGRSARVSGAEAGVERARADGRRALQETLESTALAYLQAVQLRERAQIADADIVACEALAAAAEKRLRAGDLAQPELNLARLALLRARAERRALDGEQAEARAALEALISLEAGEAIEGALVDLFSRPAVPTDSEAPELAALRAELEQTRARAGEARAARVPKLTAGARFAREEEATIILGELGLTLPLFQPASDEAAAADAESDALAKTLDAAKMRREQRGRALAAHARALTDAEQILRDAVPLAEQNEALVARAFELGELGAKDALAMRRETQAAKLEHVDRAFAAAAARAELLAFFGGL